MESPKSTKSTQQPKSNRPALQQCLVHRSISATIGHRPRQSRQKKYAPKVRTGCLTCRSRRVKCDENKPTCFRCLKGGLHCQGYLYQDSIVVDAVVRSPERLAVLHEPALSLAPVATIPSHQDMRMFHLMRTDAVQQVAGCFDFDFWALDVLKAAHIYPAIWHSCLAFAATYERLKSPDQSPASTRAKRESYVYALQHQNESIQEVVKLIGGPGLSQLDKEALVLINTLYAALCSIGGNLAESAGHFMNALTFFAELQRSTSEQDQSATPGIMASSSSASTTSSPPSSSLSPSSISSSYSTSCTLISRETYTKLLYTNRTSILPLRKQPGIHHEPRTRPFSSLQAAYLEFLEILSDLQDLSGYPSQYHGNLSPVVREAIRKTLFDWESRYVALKCTSKFSPDDQERMLAMELWLTVCKLLADGSLDPCSDVCSVPQLVIEDIIAAAEDVLKLQARKIKQHADFSFFIFYPSLHRLLFWVGHGYQDSQMRRMILAIMRRWPRRVPFWDTRHMAAILEAVMLFEESGYQPQQSDADEDADGVEGVDGPAECGCILGAPSCPRHRVARFGMRSMMEGESMLAIKTVADCEKGLPGQEFKVRW
ncbi:hypothetical protein E4U55_005686 [Claviceps digitariae]|nr:hypothetical protein E4U55_005686 [Claviceps digitariae]